MKKKEYAIELGGKMLTATFTDLADQANGSVLVRYGNTVVLATAVMSKNPKEGVDYLPLSVEFEEKFYAAGKILGGRFQKREGRPTDEAILSGRIVDRTIRPLFEQYIRNEIQVIVTVLSIQDDDPDMLSVIAASLALGVSDIPWNGPVGGVRIGKHKDSDEFEVNPGYLSRGSSTNELDLVVCGKEATVNMIEVGSKEVEEGIILKGIERAMMEIERLEAFQTKIIKEIGQEKKVIAKPEMPKEIPHLFETHIAKKLPSAIFSGPGKMNLDALKEEWLATIVQEHEEWKIEAEHYFEDQVNDLIHEEAVKNEKRPDGRNIDEIRPLFAQAGGISPIHHGLGIFYRGQTHVMSVLTLGGPGDTQLLEGMEIQMDKRFMHHYNFPPFSTGDVGRVGSANRRMIGHGALAEKALHAVIPSKEQFPYTIRLVSESLASNGSTSMASVCASTIALMDGGVPISAPVAGIASGLMMLDHKRYKVLTDIQGPEDHHGDMDFKVAGTRKGVTAVQMDVKVDGIPLHILEEAFEKAKNARMNILDTIETEIKMPRAELSPFAPEIEIVTIKKEQIGLVIGSGGKTINEIKEKTQTEIEIEDDGTVFITGKNGNAKKAAEIIRILTKEYVKGEKLKGIITKIFEFGAIAEIGPNTEGLIHISEIAPFRIDKVGDYLKVGEEVSVIIKEVDDRDRIRLSIKDADPDFAKAKRKATS